MPKLTPSKLSLQKLQKLLSDSQSLRARVVRDDSKIKPLLVANQKIAKPVKQVAANKNVTGLSSTSVIQRRRVSSTRIDSVNTHLKIAKLFALIRKQLKKISPLRLIKLSPSLLKKIGLLSKLIKSRQAAAKIGGVKLSQRKTVTVIKAKLLKATTPTAKANLRMFANKKKVKQQQQMQAAKQRKAQEHLAAIQNAAAKHHAQHKHLSN